MNSYNVAIIGGGPGGYNLAIRLGGKGKKVILFEKNALGGVCLNEGCIPTKTFLNSAKVLDKINHGKELGVVIDKGNLHLPTLVKRKNRVVKVLQAGINIQLKNANVTVQNEKVTSIAKNELFQIITENGEISAEEVVLATGGKAIIPNIEGVFDGISNGDVLTNKEILDIEELPNKLVIIGGGIIGVELAQFFALSNCQVTVIELSSQICGKLDVETAKVLQKNLEEKGVKFLLNSKVTKISENKVYYENNEEILEESFDKVLLSVGRTPNDSEIEFKNFVVEKDRKGIKVDEKMRTNIKGLYAIGDVVNIMPLAHTAYRQGEVVANIILGKEDKMEYLIPSVIYTTPEVAYVGIQENEIVEEKIKVVKLPLSYSGRYSAENTKKDCFIKVIYDSVEKVLLGGVVIGDYAGEYITTLTSYISLKTKIDDIKKIVFPHPTDVEILRETIFKM